MKDNKGTHRNVRVLKKNMIFLQSYDEQIPTSTLKQSSTFEPCGKVESVKTKQNFRNTTTYVTYSNQKSAAVALIAFSHLSSRLRVLFGTVQYCKYFMRKAECRNEDCVFQHVRDKKNEIIVNDEIDQAVYDDHYDMALRLIEDEDFKAIRNILEDQSIPQNAVVKKGLKRAAEELCIEPPLPPLRTPFNGKQCELLEQSTQQSDVTESREQVFQKSPEVEEKKQQNTPVRELISEDFLKIRLIKKLIRQSNSKFYEVGNSHDHEQIHKRGKMMLYQIVRY